MKPYRRVEGRTSLGRRYWYWSRNRNVLPPIPSHFLDAVVFLYGSQEDAQAGADSGGSGFIASIGGDWRSRSLYIVTNRHVAEKARAVRVQEPRGSRTEIVPTPEDGWRHHQDGDDVSVFPLGLDPEATFYYASISAGTSMHSVNEEQSWLGPGEDVFLLGRYIDRRGVQLDTPMARFGHIAAPPVKVRNPKRGIDQLSFLVEVLSRSGASGSPAIAFRLQLETPFMGGVRLSVGEPRDRHLQAQQGKPGSPVLLGINWGHLDEPLPVLVPGDEIYADEGPRESHERFYVEQNTGLAAVVPAWKITDLLWSDELKEMRDEEQAAKSEESKGSLRATEDAAQAPSEKPEESERF